MRREKSGRRIPSGRSIELSTSAYLELPEPLDELPPVEPPGLGVLLGDEPPAPATPPDELLPVDGAVEEPELPDGLVAEPDEDGELFVAVEPLDGLLEPLLFEPELSQATSEAAARKAAAISHLFSIECVSIMLHVLRLPELQALMRHCEPNNRAPRAKIPCPIFVTPAKGRRF